MKRLIAICLFALSSILLFVACGDDDPEAQCQSLCEEAEEKNCNTFDAGQGSCAADCELANTIAEKGGCEEERDARIQCEADQADICDAGCGAEDEAFGNCALAYCSQNTTDEDCQKLLAN